MLVTVRICTVPAFIDCIHTTGTMLGPYFGKAVRKEHMESETHEWLWEVYTNLIYKQSNTQYMCERLHVTNPSCIT